MKKAFFIVALLFAVSFAAIGPVSHYGRLQVRDGWPFIDGVKEGRDTIKLVQIRGVSFGWSNTNWESSRFYNANSVERVAKDWKAEIVRAAYGVTSIAFDNADAAANRGRVETVVDAAIENDVYVIIDWHSHNAHKEVEQAKAFFGYMAEKYGKHDNVIFELYNEPACDEYKNNSDGTRSCIRTTTWSQIKTYAEEVIPVIREHSNNLILVGTPSWCQEIDVVIGNAIDDKNIGYVLHFYARSHSLSSFMGKVDDVIKNRLLVFVTEYGTTHADGGCSPLIGKCDNGDQYDSHNAARADEWHNYMDIKKISSVAWNINDKYEGSAFFGAVRGSSFDQVPEENWSDESKMTESGKYIFKKLNGYHKCLAYNPDYDEEACKPATSPVLPKKSELSPLKPGDIVEIYTLKGKLVHAPANGIYIVRLRQNGAVQTKIMRIAK